jgi:serine/threonine protein kinase
MLYRMLAGRLPFASSDPMELVLMHRDTPPPHLTQFRTDASPRLESTAMLALSKDPSERPPDGAALLAELGVPTGGGFTTATTVLTDDQTQVLPVAPGAGPPDAGPPDPGPPPSSRRVPLIVAALLLLAVAGGALAYEVTRPASSPAPGTFTATTQQTRSTRHTTTTAPSTAPSTESTTQQSTTQQTTAAPTTQPTQPTATAPPAPTTTAPPPTTTAPPTTDTTATTGTTAAGVTVTAP